GRGRGGGGGGGGGRGRGRGARREHPRHWTEAGEGRHRRGLRRRYGQGRDRRRGRGRGRRGGRGRWPARLRQRPDAHRPLREPRIGRGTAVGVVVVGHIASAASLP